MGDALPEDSDPVGDAGASSTQAVSFAEGTQPQDGPGQKRLSSLKKLTAAPPPPGEDSGAERTEVWNDPLVLSTATVPDDLRLLAGGEGSDEHGDESSFSGLQVDTSSMLQSEVPRPRPAILACTSSARVLCSWKTDGCWCICCNGNGPSRT